MRRANWGVWGAATYPCDTPTRQEEQNDTRRREPQEGTLDQSLDLLSAIAIGCIYFVDWKQTDTD